MDNANPKVSFIPKGSLVREESFLERSRPRSVMGVIASTLFVLTFSAYAGFYYYNDKLNQVVAEKTTEIKKAQKEFSDAPEVGEAKVFRARVDLAREILNSHTVTSPVFSFLAKNTLSSVLFDHLTFKNDPALGSVLELSGEAPSYAALAFQMDTLRAQKDELRAVSVRDVRLTNFGTISFVLTMVFKKDFLLYTKNLSADTTVAPAETVATSTTTSVGVGIDFDTPSTSTSSTVVATTTEVGTMAVEEATLEATTSTETATGTTLLDAPVSETLPDNWAVSEGGSATTTETQVSWWSSLWSKIKFW
ncbi:MAG: hypothetical protein M0P64_04090 [Candidatus Pacebacteria bacterium]|jgi:hypothetical protein|nr:hypothetical protein [Candidatus Paceibacterota bacterium]